MDMQKSKEINWTGDDNAETQKESVDSRRGSDLHPNGLSAVDIWQRYRGWNRTAPAPKERRGGIDRSLYTLNGYRNWTEQVKRNWSEE